MRLMAWFRGSSVMKVSRGGDTGPVSAGSKGKQQFFLENRKNADAGNIGASLGAFA
jgi:hypothetical protein